MRSAVVLLCVAELATAIHLQSSIREQGEQDACKAAGDDMARRSTKQRIAILMRGEAFRTKVDSAHFEPWQIQGQHGYAKRHNCGDGAYEAQARLATELLNNIADMEADGFHVDIFGSTWPCVGEEKIMKELPQLYRGYMKDFRILSKAERKKSRQVTLIKDVVDLAYRYMNETGTAYQQIYILRWDHPYGCEFFRVKDVHPLPGDSKYMTGEGSSDNMFIVPAKYIPCFHAYLQNSSIQLPSPGAPREVDACCKGGCGGGTCFDCTANFMKGFYHVALPRQMGQFRSCPTFKPPRSPPADWLPDADLPENCPPHREGGADEEEEEEEEDS